MQASSSGEEMPSLSLSLSRRTGHTPPPGKRPWTHPVVRQEVIHGQRNTKGKENSRETTHAPSRGVWNGTAIGGPPLPPLPAVGDTAAGTGAVEEAGCGMRWVARWFCIVFRSRNVRGHAYEESEKKIVSKSCTERIQSLWIQCEAISG